MSTERGFTVPFIDHLGIEFVSYGQGRSHLRLTPLPEHNNAYDMAHGGVVMTLLDVTMAFAALEPEQPDMGAITVEMKTSFMRPSCGTLNGHGVVLQRTKKLVFVEGSITGDDGEICAKASGTFVIKQRPAQA